MDTRESVVCIARAATREWGTPASVGGEPGGTSGSIHGLGYLFSALRREGLIADELVLQLATFLRSLDLFLELTVRTVPRTLTTNQVWRGGKQGTDGPELSRIHSRTPHPLWGPWAASSRHKIKKPSLPECSSRLFARRNFDSGQL